jgi:MraZ protein
MGKSGGFVVKFHGRFDYSTDSKGRVNIPSRFRSALNPEANENFIICRAPGGCLRAYPKDVWETYENELMSRPETPDVLNHKRVLYNTLTDSTLDAQGRISLSAKQMELAGIVKDVTMVGQASYIEIWNTAAYDEYQKQFDNNFDTMFFNAVAAGEVRK